MLLIPSNFGYHIFSHTSAGRLLLHNGSINIFIYCKYKSGFAVIPDLIGDLIL